MWIWLAVIIPAAVPLLLRRRVVPPAVGMGTAVVGAAFGVSGALVAVAWAGGGGAPGGPVWLAAGDVALRAGLRVDALSGLLALSSLVGAIVALGPASGRRAGSCRVDLVALLVAAQLLVLLADSLWLLLVGWEAVGIVAARTMDAEAWRSRRRRRGRAALVTSRIGSLALLLAAAVLLQGHGTLAFEELGRVYPVPGSGVDAAGLAVAALVLLAAGSRAGIMPMHGWLVRAGGVPGTVGALHTGVVWTSAVYLLARLAPILESGAAVLALGAGLAVVSALSLFLAAALVPRTRMPAFLGAAHAGLVVAALCCGGGLGAVLWTAALAPLLVAVSLLSGFDPRASHGAAILSALAAVLWIGLPGLGPVVVVRSRALATLALPPVGGSGLALAAALAVAVAAVAAVAWLSGGRGRAAPSAGVLVRAGLPVAALLGTGIASFAAPGSLAGLVESLGSLVMPGEGRVRLAGGADPWLLLPGVAALAGALVAVSTRLVARARIRRLAGTGRDLRVAASRGWYLHRALRTMALRPFLVAAAALGGPATDDRDLEASGHVSPTTGAGRTIRVLVFLGPPLATLLAAGALWLALGPGLPARGLVLAATDGIAAAAVLLVTALALWSPGTAPAHGAIVGLAGALLAVGTILPPAAGWPAWALAGGMLVTTAPRARPLVALSLLGGVALLGLALLGAPLAAATVAARGTAPGWRLAVLIAGAVLLLGTAPLRGLRSRALAALPAPAAIQVAAVWPVIGIHALLRRGAWLDPGGWAAVAPWLLPAGAVIVLLAAPSALARQRAAGVAVDLHGAVIGWALIGVGTWTRSSLAGAMLLIAVQAVWLAACLLASRSRVEGPGPRGRSPVPWILAGALVAGSGAFPGLLLVLTDSYRVAPLAVLLAIAGTLLLAFPVREAWQRPARASAGDEPDERSTTSPATRAPGLRRLPRLVAALLLVAPAVWPAPLARALYRDADRILLPPVPFRPADPEIVPWPDGIAGSGAPAKLPRPWPFQYPDAPVGLSRTGDGERTGRWRDARRAGA